MSLRYAPLLCLLFAASAAAQPVPDTLWAPADSILVFGWTVDADGDRALVGAHEVRAQAVPRATADASMGDPTGTVFVFRQHAGGAWDVEGRLEADRIGHQDCFSWALDLRGDLIAVGAECEYSQNPDGSFQSGAVYLYRFDGGTWSREAKLNIVNAEGEPSTYRFGESVAVGGTSS